MFNLRKLIENMRVQYKLALGFSIAIIIGLGVTISGFVGTYKLSSLIHENWEVVRLERKLVFLTVRFHQQFPEVSVNATAVLPLEQDQSNPPRHTDIASSTGKELSTIGSELGGIQETLDTYRSDSAPNPSSRLTAAEALANSIKNAGLILAGAAAQIYADQQSTVYGIYGFLISASVLAMIGSAFAVIVISRQLVPPIKITASVAAVSYTHLTLPTIYSV